MVSEKEHIFLFEMANDFEVQKDSTHFLIFQLKPNGGYQWPHAFRDPLNAFVISSENMCN